MKDNNERSMRPHVATKRSNWGWWFHLHEPIPLSMVTRFVVHARANWLMLLEGKILALSSLIAVAPSVVFAIVLWFIDPFNPRRLQITPINSMAFLTLLCGVLLIWLLVQHFFFVYAMNRYYAPFVRRELIKRGTPLCYACGHRLANMSVLACSECGTQFKNIS